MLRLCITSALLTTIYVKAVQFILCLSEPISIANYCIKFCGSSVNGNDAATNATSPTVAVRALNMDIFQSSWLHVSVYACIWYIKMKSNKRSINSINYFSADGVVAADNDCAKWPVESVTKWDKYFAGAAARSLFWIKQISLYLLIANRITFILNI